MRLAILFALLVLTTPVTADPILKNDIRNTAFRIAELAQYSDATAATLRDLLAQLRRVERELDGRAGVQLFCEPRSSSYAYVARVSDGTRLGTDVSNTLCATLVANSQNGLVCAPRSSSYAYVTDIATGHTIGTDTANETCMGLVTASTHNLVCGPRSSSYAYVHRLSDLQALGTDVDLGRCKEVISNATHDLVCAPRSSSYAYITKIATGQTLGSDVSFESCYAQIRR